MWNELGYLYGGVVRHPVEVIWEVRVEILAVLTACAMPHFEEF